MAQPQKQAEVSPIKPAEDTRTEAEKTAAAKAALAARFKVVKPVTIPLLKIEKDRDYYLKFNGEMHIGKQLDEKKEAATLMQCTNLEDGELVQIICPTVMQKELLQSYPNKEYVGKSFKLRLFRIPEKRYNLISLAEVSEA